MPQLEHYLILSAVVLTIGMYGALTKSNIITVLMSVEIMFAGVTIAAVAMSRFITPALLVANPGIMDPSILRMILTGQVFALFVITVAAAEVAVGLAIVIAAYHHREAIDITGVSEMRH